MVKYLLFDLDGTLTDSYPGISECVRCALEKFNIEIEDPEFLRRFIGPPLVKSFRQYIGLSEEEADMAVNTFREKFNAGALFHNRVYEGIPETLAALKAEGYILAVATSKPEPQALAILEHFGLKDYFHFIIGATYDSKRSEKADVIAYALEKCGITDRSEAVMIGDRQDDILGGIRNGIGTIGVLYGYGSKEELAGAGAVAFANTPENILRVIHNLHSA